MGTAFSLKDEEISSRGPTRSSNLASWARCSSSGSYMTVAADVAIDVDMTLDARVAGRRMVSRLFDDSDILMWTSKDGSRCSRVRGDRDESLRRQRAAWRTYTLAPTLQGHQAAAAAPFTWPRAPCRLYKAITRHIVAGNYGPALVHTGL